MIRNWLWGIFITGCLVAAMMAAEGREPPVDPAMPSVPQRSQCGEER